MLMRLVRIFAQAWRLLKENPVLGTISILGTALAIGMVTITVAAKRLIPEGDFYPAFKRQRMLYYKYAVTEPKDTLTAGNYTAGRLGYPLASAIAGVPAAEMASIHEVYTAGVEFLLPGEEDAEVSRGRVRSVDIPFWQIYDFDFVHGTPFTPEEERSAARVIVLAQSLSQKLFGNQDPVGRDVLMQYIPYRVVGVVRDVSGYLTELAANAWIPLSIFHNAERDMDVHGDLQVDFLAASVSDFPAIREQVLRKLQEFSTTLDDGEVVVPYGQPEPLRAALARGGWMIEPPDLGHLNLIFYVTVLILLLVPGINLVALSYARMRRRLQELGVRRAFGATTVDLLGQIVGESLFFTLIGAVLGVLLMVATAYLLKNVLFIKEMGDIEFEFTLPLSVLLSWRVVLAAVGFSLLLNLLSMLLPAWRLVRRDIVSSLNAKR